MRGALIAAALCAAVAGCGSERGAPREAAGALEWVSSPRIVEATTTEPARILQGEVRNRSDDELRIAATDVVLRDSGGARVPGSAIFLQGYVRPGDPQNRGGEPFSDTEAERIGRLALIAPGETAPLVVSWRLSDGRPSEIAFPSGALPIAGS